MGSGPEGDEENLNKGKVNVVLATAPPTLPMQGFQVFSSTVLMNYDAIPMSAAAGHTLPPPE